MNYRKSNLNYRNSYSGEFSFLKALYLKELLSQVGDEEISIRITGSIGMGVSETCAISFVQEVVAAAKAIQKDYPAMASMIDIGGEDAKVVFFKDCLLYTSPSPRDCS